MSKKVLKAYKFRIYPNAKQTELIEKTFGCTRLVYNLGLDMRNNAFKNNEKANYNTTSSMLTTLKREDDFVFLNEVDSVALQQSLRDLDTAFSNFFKKKSKYPNFKSKRKSRSSYRTFNINVKGNKIKLPKIGFIKIKLSQNVDNIHNATIFKTKTGKYFVSLLCEKEINEHINNLGEVGIDVGIKDFCVFSNGIKIDNPKYLKKYTTKLIREQRKLSRRIHLAKSENQTLSECKNIEKQRIKVARVHEKISNCRNDFLQKLSTQIVSENKTICIEDLNIEGMVKNHKLAKSINDVSWPKFFDMLKYKAEWYGSKVVEVPRFYASSQTCNVCETLNHETKDLNVRTWECPNCHTLHDRDINAAINILNKGLTLLNA